ncbi:DNA/RNA non-specific endonuclease [Actinomadura oligospora]|uniref:DNA/RNA non-specific endonuclease n=1 Tax=Actinomadura oligospora TaxID=111804 RepID=UPI00047B7B12|nr:DNA/RNA non-specific endonuclease [Actinomadura oligospora]
MTRARAALALVAVATAATACTSSAGAAPHSKAGEVASSSKVDQVPCAEHLKPNATYHANGASYHTDSKGRPERAEASDLKSSVADRGSCQGKAGHMSGTTGYDGGHLIAATLKGVDERYDLVPQWASLNRGLYERMEAGTKRCLTKPGGRILHYRIRVTYANATTLTPNRYSTDIQVGTRGHSAQTIKLTMANRALTTTENTRLRAQLDKSLTAAGCK